MAEDIMVTTTDQLANGEMKSFKVSGKEILIAREGDTYYAAENRCPHMGGNLSKGSLEGHIITCPLHHSQFDLATGKVIRWTDFTGIALALGKAVKKPRPLKTYPVAVKEKGVMVSLIP